MGLIQWETLDTAKSLPDLVKKEAHWIEKFNALNSNFGYNSRRGNITPKKADRIEKVRVQVDIPEKLRASLEKEANESYRKLSNYIVHILKQRKNIWNKQ
ncbi:hypothetical protein [Shimazuella kribbensis]|uniref:hypothetical protein n=1 Tax=Shimazuella kribbensis TaxID=139808 RepID=UPI0004265EA1|nr:hypothetical protein [Shimazuella kribbensis]